MQLSDVARKMIITMCVSLVLIIAVSAAYYRSVAFLSFALGGVLGVGTNIIKVIMLSKAVDRALEMDKKDGGNYIRFQYFLRFILTGLVLVLSATVSFINLYGAIAGILIWQVATIVIRVFPEERESPKA